MSTQVLRFGVIGTGMMGCEHLRNLVALPGAEIAAVCDPNPAPREWARLTLGEAHPAVVLDDHHALLARDDLDALVIASPNHTHAAVLDDVFAAAPALPVLVEKPMCTTLDDCRRVVEHAARRDAIVWVGLEYRYMPPVARFLSEIADGATGPVKMVAVREHRYPFLPKVGNWNRFNRNTGGTLVEKCCHFFDLMRLVTASPAVRVYASGGQDVNHLDERYDGDRPDILDNAFVVVDYASGARGCLDLCMFAEASRNEQELVAVGPLGKVEAFVPSGIVRVGNRERREVDEFDAAHDERVAYEGFHHGASYLELAAFADAVRRGEPPAVGVLDGMWSVAMGIAAQLSIEEGRPVEMHELGAEFDEAQAALR
jgi:predicted dehydrogenase